MCEVWLLFITILFFPGVSLLCLSRQLWAAINPLRTAPRASSGWCRQRGCWNSISAQEVTRLEQIPQLDIEEQIEHHWWFDWGCCCFGLGLGQWETVTEGMCWWSLTLPAQGQSGGQGHSFAFSPGQSLPSWMYKLKAPCTRNSSRKEERNPVLAPSSG